MIQTVTALSMAGVLLLPTGVPPPAQKDCHILRCIPDGDIPDEWETPPANDPTPPRRRSGDPDRPPPTTCEPRDPRPAEPDVAAMPLPQGGLVHSAGSGSVVVGMDTEYEWRGPRQVTWTQPGRAGRREDCSWIPAERTEFTATLTDLTFEFEQGERTRYVTDTGKVTHRYTTIPADEDEELFTVCVYAGYEIPGDGFETLMLVEELDHDVVEIRSTLID